MITPRQRAALGLAQTTAILRSNSETARGTSYLYAPALGRAAGFPGGLGEPGPRAHEIYRGSEAHPEAFPHKSPGEGAGLEAARVALCWGWPGDLWPGTFPSETHALPAWEANRALVMGRRKARCGFLADPHGAQEIDFLEISDLS